MKKITVKKNEGIAEVIDRMLAAADPEIVFSIPKGAALGKSASNFQLLKREAGLAEKKIMIDTAEEHIASLAQANGIAIFGEDDDGKAAGREGEETERVPVKRYGALPVSDIVARGADETIPDNTGGSARNSKKHVQVKLSVREEREEREDKEDGEAQLVEETKREERQSMSDAERFFKRREPSSADDGSDDDDEDGSSRGMSGKAIGWTIAAIVILAAVFYGITMVFGRAQVTIDFVQTPWTYAANFIADKSVASITPGSNTIPAQVFSTQKNTTQQFPATGGTATVSVKAQGTITIYNDYGPNPQDLVATTRFLTPDGKIFRLVDSVTVPGAQVAGNGQITPASITVPIVADQGGPAYNVGPVPKLTIPGFQDVPPKYAGFYGAIASGTTGGFIGMKPVPTAQDIADAKAKMTAILQSELQDGLSSSYPGNFKILDGATNIQITKLVVSTTTDANGNFTVLGEATLQAIGFDESALKSYLLSVAQAGSSTDAAANSTFKAITLNYSNVQASFSKGQVSFSLGVQGTLEPAFSANDFVGLVAGKSISMARDTIQALPQLSDGKISVWPVWLWSMPSDPKKIQVDVN